MVEAALRNPHVERHLAALEPVDRDAGTALLALLAAPGGLALAGSDAASDAHAAFAGAFIVTKIVELDSHCTRFRCVRAMDRPEGLVRFDFTRWLKAGIGDRKSTRLNSSH